MGGRNSGFPIWRERKNTVEQCIHMDAAWFGLGKRPVDRLKGDIAWTDPRTGVKKSGVDVLLDLRNLHGAFIEISFRVKGAGPIQIQHIPLVYSRPFYGGIRWWFLCPLCGEQGLAPLRVRKLLLPLDGGTAFGCRRCHDLTYDSNQDSHRFDRLFLDLAREVYGSHGDDDKMLAEHIRSGLVSRSF